MTVVGEPANFRIAAGALVVHDLVTRAELRLPESQAVLSNIHRRYGRRSPVDVEDDRGFQQPQRLDRCLGFDRDSSLGVDSLGNHSCTAVHLACADPRGGVVKHDVDCDRRAHTRAAAAAADRRCPGRRDVLQADIAARSHFDVARGLDIRAVQDFRGRVHGHDVDADAACDRGAGSAAAFLLRARAGDAPDDEVVRFAGWCDRFDGDAVTLYDSRIADARGVVNDAYVDADAGRHSGGVAATSAAPTAAATAAATVTAALRQGEADRLGRGVGFSRRTDLDRATGLDAGAILDFGAGAARQNGYADRCRDLDLRALTALASACIVLARPVGGLVVALADLVVCGR